MSRTRGPGLNLKKYIIFKSSNEGASSGASRVIFLLNLSFYYLLFLISAAVPNLVAVSSDPEYLSSAPMTFPVSGTYDSHCLLKFSLPDLLYTWLRSTGCPYLIAVHRLFHLLSTDRCCDVQVLQSTP